MDSDIQFIEGIKRRHLSRKKTAILTISMAVVSFTLSYFIYKAFNIYTFEQVELYIPHYANVLLSNSDIDHIKQATELAHKNGLILGIFLGLMLSVVITTVMQALFAFISDRANHLLIKYYEQSKT